MSNENKFTIPLTEVKYFKEMKRFGESPGKRRGIFRAQTSACFFSMNMIYTIKNEKY